jgi:DNA-binding CsgD family transcriptional regulator
MKTTSQLIDQIYAAALDPAGWSVALKSLQDFFQSLSIGIYSVDLHGQKATPLDLQNVDPDFVRTYIDQYIYDNPWIGIPELQVPGLIRTDSTLDQHLNSPGYYRSTEYFNEWMRPQDFIHSLGVNLLSCQGLLTKFYMYRPEQVGPFTRQELAHFKLVLGHMINAIEVGRRLEVRNAQVSDAMHLMDKLRFGTVFLDEQMRVLQVNRFAEELSRQLDGLKIVQGMIHAAHREDEKALTGMVEVAMEVHRGHDVKVPPAVRLRRSSGKRPLCVIALPLPRRSNPFLVRQASMVLVFADPELAPVVPGDDLQERYGLTANEARLAQYLVQGVDLRGAAAKVGISYEIARTYLKIIFQKTGTSRQPELIRLLVSEQVVLER